MNLRLKSKISSTHTKEQISISLWYLLFFFLTSCTLTDLEPVPEPEKKPLSRVATNQKIEVFSAVTWQAMIDHVLKRHAGSINTSSGDSGSALSNNDAGEVGESLPVTKNPQSLPCVVPEDFTDFAPSQDGVEVVDAGTQLAGVGAVQELTQDQSQKPVGKIIPPENPEAEQARTAARELFLGSIQKSDVPSMVWCNEPPPSGPCTCAGLGLKPAHSGIPIEGACFTNIRECPECSPTVDPSFNGHCADIVIPIEDENGNCSLEFIRKRECDEGCFVASTKILMADFKEKPISKLRAGDYVWNPVRNRPVKVKKVVAGPEKTPLVSIKTKSKLLDVTASHPMLTPIGIVPARQLKTGDLVQVPGGRWKKVLKLRRYKLPNTKFVFNLELDVKSNNPYDRMVLSEGIITGDLIIQQRLHGSQIRAPQERHIPTELQPLSKDSNRDIRMGSVDRPVSVD